MSREEGRGLKLVRVYTSLERCVADCVSDFPFGMMTTLTIATLTMIQAFQGPAARGVPRRASLLLSEEPARVRAAPPAPHVQSVAEELRAILAEEEQAEADLAEAEGVIGEATMRALGMEDGLSEYRAFKEELRALGSEAFEAELALLEPHPHPHPHPRPKLRRSSRCETRTSLHIRLYLPYISGGARARGDCK